MRSLRIPLSPGRWLPHFGGCPSPPLRDRTSGSTGEYILASPSPGGGALARCVTLHLPLTVYTSCRSEALFTAVNRASEWQDVARLLEQSDGFLLYLHTSYRSVDVTEHRRIEGSPHSNPLPFHLGAIDTRGCRTTAAGPSGHRCGQHRREDAVSAPLLCGSVQQMPRFTAVNQDRTNRVFGIGACTALPTIRPADPAECRPFESSRRRRWRGLPR